MTLVLLMRIYVVVVKRIMKNTKHLGGFMIGLKKKKRIQEQILQENGRILVYS